MSWASARRAHGLDEPPGGGPHERWYPVIWGFATAAMAGLIVLVGVALLLVILHDGLGWDVPPGVNDALTAIGLATFGTLGGALPAMFAVDAADRRRARADDELQAALPPGHYLARP